MSKTILIGAAGTLPRLVDDFQIIKILRQQFLENKVLVDTLSAMDAKYRSLASVDASSFLEESLETQIWRILENCKNSISKLTRECLDQVLGVMQKGITNEEEKKALGEFKVAAFSENRVKTQMLVNRVCSLGSSPEAREEFGEEVQDYLDTIVRPDPHQKGKKYKIHNKKEKFTIIC